MLKARYILMLKTIEQVAIQLNVSKATIYKKIKLDCFKDDVVMKLGIAMLDDETITLIETDIKSKRNYKPNKNTEPPEDTEETEKLDDTILSEEYLRLNKDYIEQLKEQIREKDVQLANFDLRMKAEQELNKNNQILLKDKPTQNILLLEEHFQDLDTKLEEVKENMIQRKEQQKGFFSKIFKKQY